MLKNLLNLVLSFFGVKSTEYVQETWWGTVNEANGWGIVYPFDIDGSFLRVDTINESSDVTYITADKTIY